MEKLRDFIVVTNAPTKGAFYYSAMHEMTPQAF